MEGQDWWVRNILVLEKKKKPLRKQNLGMDIHILCRHIDNHMFIRMIVDSLTILSYCLYLN